MVTAEAATPVIILGFAPTSPHLAISRFNAFHRLRDELDRTKQALEDRKVIDKAKGILMSTRKISEEDAYALLRKTAMNESRRMADVARSLVTAAKLLS